MLILLAAVALPANLLGLAALVLGFRGKRSTPMLVVGLFGLLMAMATTSMTVIGGIELDHLTLPDVAMGDAAEREALRRQLDGEVRILALSGVGASLLPWIGSIFALVRARRIDD